MTSKTLLLISMVFIFVSYVGFIWIRYGVLKSISASYYKLPEKYNFIFTLFCYGFAFPAAIIGDNILMFISAGAICFVGAAASFEDDLTRQVHMIGAITGVILSQISILYDYRLWEINLIFVIPTIFLFFMMKRIPSFLWWIEILAFCCVILSFIFN